MKITFIFLLSLLVLSSCASKKTIEIPVAEAPIDREAIRTTIISNKHDIQACYDVYLRDNPQSEKGKLVLEWDIIDAGVAEKITLSKSTFKDDILFQCVANKIKDWKFPSPPKEQFARVSYPFLFNPN